MSNTQGLSTAEVADTAKNPISQDTQKSIPELSTSPRGPFATPVDAEELDNDKILQYLQDAITAERGNEESGSPPDRRALIVVPNYLSQGEVPLPGTRLDAVLIHNLLVHKFQYKPTEIRILSEVHVPNYGDSVYSTRSNVLAGLDWLVDDTQTGQHRLFYFSGHGRILEKANGQGKRAMVLPKDYQTAEEKDTERSDDLLNKLKLPTRVYQQKIKSQDLAYYTEEIVTTRDAGRPRDRSITDQELNAKFSILPPGSRLTCLIDCCHGGRMIDNAIKLLGYGICGPLQYNIAQASITETVDPRHWAPLAASADQPAEGDTTDDVIIYDELSEGEKARDTIRADTLTWAASHQRQFAGYHTDHKCGLLTWFFVQCLQENSDITVEDLHKQIEENVLKMGLGQANVQYVQLRMSPKDADQSAAKEAKVDI